MELSRGQVELLFEKSLLTSGSGVVGEGLSRSMSMNGNAAILSCTMMASDGLGGGNRLIVSLEGSYDKKAWFSLPVSVSFDADGIAEKTSGLVKGVDVFAVRARASLSVASGDVSVLFDVSLSMTRQ